MARKAWGWAKLALEVATLVASQWEQEVWCGLAPRAAVMIGCHFHLCLATGQ